MRVVAGRFRGRVLAAPEGRDTRPTADRAREALFNILTHGDPALKGARVADIFAGSGALGFEALSRGAHHVSFFETAPKALAAIQANIDKLGCPSECTVLRGDATKPAMAVAPCQFLLLDPPYHSGLSQRALPALQSQGWIAKDALIVVELAADEDFVAPLDGFAISDERRYGAAKFIFLKA